MVSSNMQARLMVGLEIHVELATRSKMFTSAANVAHPDYSQATPNTLCDVVVLGMPGVLPVVNREAVEMSIKVGLALNCKIARFTKWDRKSYYYPDLPKNYQISQYDQPLCADGQLAVQVSEQAGTQEKVIRILRAHLEEDAGKLLHEAPGGGVIEGSIVDLNRAGTPLLEIVTQPDFESAEEVNMFCQKLRDICKGLGVTEGDMQKGHMRFEPNINVVIEKDGKTYKTPIVEVKNLNSFKAVVGAVEYEYHRQIEEFERTGQVMKPGSKTTRGWDDAAMRTFVQREKEEAHDYRYFPDPDLMPVVVDEAWLERIRATMEELPQVKRERYVKVWGLGEKETEQLLAQPRVAKFFEAVVAAGIEGKRAAAIVLNNLARRANDQGVLVSDLPITAEQVAVIEGMQKANQISATAADELYKLCSGAVNDGSMNPRKLAEEKGLLQVSDDGALLEWVEQVVGANAKAVEAFKAGKENAISSLIGAVMKLSKGKANPKRVTEILRERMSR